MCLVIFPLTIGGNKQAFFALNNSKRKCEKKSTFSRHAELHTVVYGTSMCPSVCLGITVDTLT